MTNSREGMDRFLRRGKKTLDIIKQTGKQIDVATMEALEEAADATLPATNTATSQRGLSDAKGRDRYGHGAPRRGRG